MSSKNDDSIEADYWNNIYQDKKTEEVSWYQTYPETSVNLVKECNMPLSANIINIGGGDSFFVDALLDNGYRNIYVLDIAASAIERAKLRLGEKASFVHWIISDVKEFKPDVQFDFWHDRAAFHFLTGLEKIEQYVSIASNAIRQNGYLTIGTFSETGPQKCSGLHIKQYSEGLMSTTFSNGFNKLRCFTEDHITSFNTAQNFFILYISKELNCKVAVL